MSENILELGDRLDRDRLAYDAFWEFTQTPDPKFRQHQVAKFLSFYAQKFKRELNDSRNDELQSLFGELQERLGGNTAVARTQQVLFVACAMILQPACKKHFVPPVSGVADAIDYSPVDRIAFVRAEKLIKPLVEDFFVGGITGEDLHRRILGAYCAFLPGNVRERVGRPEIKRQRRS